MLIMSLSMTADLIGINTVTTIIRTLYLVIILCLEYYEVYVLHNVQIISLLILDVYTNLQATGAFVYGSMSLLDKISNGIVIAMVQHFHPDHCTPVDCPTAQYYRYFSQTTCFCNTFSSYSILVFWDLK